MTRRPTTTLLGKLSVHVPSRSRLNLNLRMQLAEVNGAAEVIYEISYEEQFLAGQDSGG